MALKLMKIEESVKEDIDILKNYENESYTSIIKRIIEENNELREDKASLFKVILKENELNKTSLSIYYFIANVIDNTEASDEDKLQVLEKYLNPYIEVEPKAVLDNIDYFKINIEDAVPEVLIKFEKYVKSSLWFLSFRFWNWFFLVTVEIIPTKKNFILFFHGY